jgi:hypothetical protein
LLNAGYIDTSGVMNWQKTIKTATQLIAQRLARDQSKGWEDWNRKSNKEELLKQLIQLKVAQQQ